MYTNIVEKAAMRENGAGNAAHKNDPEKSIGSKPRQAAKDLGRVAAADK